MPSNTNYVCFDCRMAVRKPKRYSLPVLCPNCQQRMQYLSYKLAIPKRNKIREWRALHQLITDFPIKQNQYAFQSIKQHYDYEINTLKHQLSYQSSPKRQNNLSERLNQTLAEQKCFKKRTLLVYRFFGIEAFTYK